MALRILQFVAIVLVAITLVPVGAHLFEMPHKIAMTEEQYFTVQGIYSGWSLFGAPWIGAIVVTVVLALMLRARGRPFRLVLVTAACLVAGLAVFFTWTFPANQATQNWTVAPENWADLRRQWEYAHAASAVLNFIGFCALALSMLGSQETPRR